MAKISRVNKVVYKKRADCFPAFLVLVGEVTGGNLNRNRNMKFRFEEIHGFMNNQRGSLSMRNQTEKLSS